MAFSYASPPRLLALGAAAVAATLTTTSAEPPRFDYFDPPSASPLAEVSIVGKNMETVNRLWFWSAFEGGGETPITATSEDELRFSVPNYGDTGDLILDWVAVGVSPDGAAVTLPHNVIEIVPGADGFASTSQLVSRVTAITAIAELKLPAACICVIESGADVRISYGIYTILLVRAGAKVDLSPLVGPKEFVVIFETGADITPPEVTGPTHTPPVYYEVPAIRASTTRLFLGSPTPPTLDLSTSSGGAGAGSVSLWPDKRQYYVGDEVTFTATPDEGSSFGTWAGLHQGETNPFTISLGGDLRVTAEFIDGFLVDVAASGGTVTLDPPIDRFAPGTEVTATFHPLPGHTFTGWSGDVTSAENPVTFTVTAETALTATAAPPPEFPLAWTWQPGASGEPPPNYDRDYWTDVAVAEDGTAYVGWMPDPFAVAGDGVTPEFYALGPDGSVIWTKAVGGPVLAPALTPAGTVVLADGSRLQSIRPDGVAAWTKSILEPSGRQDDVFSISVHADSSISLTQDYPIYQRLSAAGAVLPEIEALYPRNGYPPSISLDGSLVIASIGNEDGEYGHAIHRIGSGLEEVLESVFVPNHSSVRASSWLPYSGTIAATGAIYWPARIPNDTYHLVKHVPGSGEIDFVPDTANTLTAPVVTQAGMLVFPDGDGVLRCIDPATDETLWSIPGFANTTPLAALDGSVFAVTDDPENPVIYQIDADGEAVSYFPGITDPGAPDPATQLALDEDRDLPRRHTGARPPVHLAIGPEGTLYAASRNGQLYALETGARLSRSTWPKAFGNAANSSRVLPFAPVVTAQPEAGTAVGGEPFALEVAFDARPAASVQWFRDGEPLVDGGDAPVLDLSDPVPDDAGTYFARITNSAGSTDSEAVTVEVAYDFAVQEAAGALVESTLADGRHPALTAFQVTATPAAGFEFVSWSGSSESTDNPLAGELVANTALAPVVRDVAAPVFALANPLPDTTNTSPLAVEGSVSDNDGGTSLTLTLALNGGEAVEVVLLENGGFATGAIELTVGENHLVLTASDGAGNVEVIEKTVTFTPDRLVSAHDAGAVEGREVALPVTLTSSGGVGGLGLAITFDPEQLVPLGVEFPPSLASAFTTTNTETPGIVRLSAALPGGSLPSGETAVCSVLFRARSVPATLGAAVGIEIADISDSLGTPLTGGNGSLGATVTITPRQFTGDVNTNGRLDVGDAHRLQRLLVGSDPPRDWDIALNDLNGSGTLDSGDLIRLLRAAAAIDPQPTPPAPAVARLVLPLPPLPLGESPLLLEIPSQPDAAAEGLTVRVVAGPGIEATAGIAFTLAYPVEALRLDGAGSHTIGESLPADSSVLWNVSPAVLDYAAQDGTVSVAASHAAGWPGLTPGDTVAELTFVVQPAASAQAVWPLVLTAAEVPVEEGYRIAAAPEQTAFFIPTPQSQSDWLSSYFEPGQLGDPEIVSPSSDPDNDGRPNASERFSGTSPVEADAGAPLSAFRVTDGTDEFFAVSFVRATSARHLPFDVEWSQDMRTWSPLDRASDLVSAEPGPGGLSERLTYRLPSAVSAATGAFVRLAFPPEG